MHCGARGSDASARAPVDLAVLDHRAIEVSPPLDKARDAEPVLRCEGAPRVLGDELFVQLERGAIVAFVFGATNALTRAGWAAVVQAPPSAPPIPPT